MLNRALELGATHMVTGHYAQVNYNEETGLYELHKGVDSTKDQSYVMYNMNPVSYTHLLASIASVSHFSLTTRKADSDLGTRTTIYGNTSAQI